MLPRIVSILLCCCLGASVSASAGKYVSEDDYVFPIPGLSWPVGVSTSMHKLEHPYFHFLDVTGPERTGDGKRVIHIAQGTVMLKTPADIDLIFSGDELHQVRLVFDKAPPFPAMVAWLTKRYGKPCERVLPTKEDNENRAAWQATLCGHVTRVDLTRRNGKTEVLYLRLPDAQ